MIRFENVSKGFWIKGEYHPVIRNLNLTLPTGKSLALLGRNGAGKSTLLKIVAGNLRPDTGRIVSDGSLSFTVGYSGSFHGDMTGLQNTRFVARVYGVDSDDGVPPLKWSTNWDSMIPFQEDQRWLERETNPKMWC